jgi:uncharacterized protein (TIGR02453 family)
MTDGAKFTGFPKQARQFLVELSQDNDRDWFKANQERYESLIREPGRAFVRAMAGPLAKVSAEFTADDRKVGGSLMRPQKDTRFSKGADPYKTNVGIQFRHSAGKDVHAPGFYLHFDPGESFLGAGLWRPEPKVLAAIRKAIDKDPAKWNKVKNGKAFRESFSLAGNSLVRAPKGYSPEHPQIEDLRRKDFIAVCQLSMKDLHSKTLVADTAKRFRACKTWMQYLCDAAGVNF